MLSSGDLVMRSLSSHHAPMARGKAMRVRMVVSIVFESGCGDCLLVYFMLTRLLYRRSHSNPSREIGHLGQGQKVRSEMRRSCENVGKGRLTQLTFVLAFDEDYASLRSNQLQGDTRMMSQSKIRTIHFGRTFSVFSNHSAVVSSRAYVRIEYEIYHTRTTTPRLVVRDDYDQVEDPWESPSPITEIRS